MGQTQNIQQHSLKESSNSFSNSFSSPSPKCKDCKKNHISKKFKSSSIMLCEDCYLKRKKKYTKRTSVLKVLSKSTKLLLNYILVTTKARNQKRTSVSLVSPISQQLGTTYMNTTQRILHIRQLKQRTMKKEKLLITSFLRLSSLIGRKSATFTAGQGCHGQVLQ